jgi:hypothetical protein
MLFYFNLSRKCKAVPLHAMEALGGEEIYLLLILDLGIRRVWVVSVTPRPLFNSGERTPSTHCTGSWVGPRVGLDTKARGKILYICRGSNLDRSVVQFVARHYTDWAIPAPKSLTYHGLFWMYVLRCMHACMYVICVCFCMCFCVYVCMYVC